MRAVKTNSRTVAQHEKTFARFTMGQRWEHAALFMSIFVLMVTGLPQKYREMPWS